MRLPVGRRDEAEREGAPDQADSPLLLGYVAQLQLGVEHTQVRPDFADRQHELVGDLFVRGRNGVSSGLAGATERCEHPALVGRERDGRARWFRGWLWCLNSLR